jgi:hypothetical protein
MNNYEKMLSDACRRFTTYDMTTLAQRPGVEDLGEVLKTCFLGETVLLRKKDGQITIGGRLADFGETLSILDWLCDGKPDAKAAECYCTVGSLPGVYVGGSGLMMSGGRLAAQIDAAPQAFRGCCEAMGGREVALGDLGFEIPIFPDLSAQLKFYHGDEEFPPQLTFLWDQNMLQFVRYETVYYIAGCVQKRLLG